MNNDLMLGGVYILMAMMLVLGALMARREPAAKLAKMALAWVVIFAAGFVLFTFRDDFGDLARSGASEAARCGCISSAVMSCVDGSPSWRPIRRG